MSSDSQRLFGTDGVRGVANTELSPQLAFKLARAAGVEMGFGTETVRAPRMPGLAGFGGT